MASAVLQTSRQRVGVVLDPRTKLLLLLTMAVFCLGGAGGSAVDAVLPAILLMPFALLLISGKWRLALIGVAAYVGSDLFMQLVRPHLTGVVQFVALGSCAILNRFLPSILMAAYVMGTTTVSEFVAAMQRMRVSQNVYIPLSVMFRFFPTVADEASSIGCAMRMRDIRLGGREVTKMVEYRLVPLMACCVKIGDELSAAALTRGLGGDAVRTNICEIGFHAQDVVSGVLCAVPWTLLVCDLASNGLSGALL